MKDLFGDIELENLIRDIRHDNIRDNETLKNLDEITVLLRRQIQLLEFILEEIP